jgi:PmbA protein
MDLLKNLKSLAEQVEVLSLQTEETTVSFEANRLKASQVEETSGLAVRVVRNGRLGFAASSDLQALDKLAANALESAAYGDVVPINFPAPAPGAQVSTFDKRIVDLPVSKMVDIGQEIVDMIQAIEPEARVNVSLRRGIQNASLRNQAGLDVRFERSPFSVDLEIDRVEGDDVLILYDSFGATIWDDDVLAFARRLAEKLVISRKITVFKPGKMPVLFSPSGTLVLGLPLMQGLDGKNVYTGISPLKGKTGEKLFDNKLSMIDDGTLDGRFGSAAYDDEGVPRRKNTLIENGVLNGFLYDLKTAALSGAESTGNGGRSLFYPPNPSPSNLAISAGQTPLAEMLAGIDEGILVEDVLGLGQGNIISGAFSNPLNLALKIEKGEVVGRVKNASIADNVYTLLKEVSAVSCESQWVYSAISLPYILIPQMNVVGKEI